MRQLTYALSKDRSFDDVVRLVTALPAYRTASSSLLVVFEPHGEHRPTVIRHLKEAAQKLPHTQVIGMTTQGPMATGVRVPTQTVCTFLLFEHATLVTRAFNCHDTSPRDAGCSYVATLRSQDDVRGILCFSSRVTTSPEPFINAVGEAFPDVPIFGSLAGSAKVVDDESLIFCGEDLYDCGVLAVALCGADLHVSCNYSLGWRAIGKELKVTAYEGHGIVATIDGSPAVSVYDRYLNVTPDEFFFEHVCPFPLVMKRNGRLIAWSPLGYTPTGKLRFSMDVPKGTAVQLSYSKPEYLLQSTLASANEVAEVVPQGLLLFVCLSRRVLLGDERADREIGYYQSVCPDASYVYGNGEVLRVADDVSILNNSIVAVALREGPAPDVEVKPLGDSALEVHGNSIPLSDRLVTFLEATTAELNETIADLARVAEHDQLTGVFNRRRMDDLIRYELSKRRADDSLVLLMYDIDYFKRINDTFGHDVGDIVLRDLTRLVNSTVRTADMLGRWGGEEFLCLLTGTSLSNGMLVAERIRRNVESNSFGRVGQVTISIGVTSAVRGDTLETMFSRVDKALYDAKRGGRNRICVR